MPFIPAHKSLIPKMRRLSRSPKQMRSTFAALVSHSAAEEVPNDEVSKKVLYWTPRGLCIAFALFLSMFAMDVFGEGWLLADFVSPFMHLIPVFVLLWSWPGLGWDGSARPLFAGGALLFLLTCQALRATKASCALIPAPFVIARCSGELAEEAELHAGVMAYDTEIRDGTGAARRPTGVPIVRSRPTRSLPRDADGRREPVRERPGVQQDL